MIQKTIEAAKPTLDSLAAKLGVAVPHLWAVLTRQGYVEAVGAIVFSIIVGVAFYFAHRIWRKVVEMDRGKADDYLDRYFFAFVIGGIVLAICMIIAIIWSATSIGYLYNPEYYAIKTVLDALK